MTEKSSEPRCPGPSRCAKRRASLHSVLDAKNSDMGAPPSSPPSLTPHGPELLPLHQPLHSDVPAPPPFATGSASTMTWLPPVLSSLRFQLLCRATSCQLAHYQVVRMTKCERTTCFPRLLRGMVDYLGFRWLPEYQVFEIPLDFGQTFYRAIVRIRGDDGGTVHKYEAASSSVDMAVHLAPYDAVVTLRRDYYCFNYPPFCYVPYFTYTDSPYETDAIDRTAQFGQSSHSVSRALRLELAAVSEQLQRALSHLGQSDRGNVTQDVYPRFQLPPLSHVSSVGEHTLERGPLLPTFPDHVGPLLYGRQTPDADFCEILPVVPEYHAYFDRRYTNRLTGEGCIASPSEGSAS